MLRRTPSTTSAGGSRDQVESGSPGGATQGRGAALSATSGRPSRAAEDVVQRRLGARRRRRTGIEPSERFRGKPNERGCLARKTAGSLGGSMPVRAVVCRPVPRGPELRCDQQCDRTAGPIYSQRRFGSSAACRCTGSEVAPRAPGVASPGDHDMTPRVTGRMRERGRWTRRSTPSSRPRRCGSSCSPPAVRRHKRRRCSRPCRGWRSRRC